MIEVSIKVDTSKLDKYMGALPPKLSSAVAVAIKKSAFLVEREAKLESPVDTGRLRASIYTDITPTQATISPYVNYAVFVHEGTRYIRSNPFLNRASKNAEPTIQDIFDQEISNAIE